jgi:hypothetical protein
MGMGTGGKPTTDNIPETTKKLGCPTDNVPETMYLSVVSGILSVVGIPPVPITTTEEISVAHE